MALVLETTVPCGQAEDGAPQKVVQGRRPFQTRIAFSRDGSQLLTIGNAVRLIDVDSGQVKQAWSLKPDVFVSRAEFVPGPVSKFVAGTHDGAALVWSDSWDEPEFRFAKQEGMLTDLAVSHDGSHLASCYNVFREGKPGTGTVVLWNLKTGELLQKATVEERSIYSVRFAPDGRDLAYTIDASPNGDSTLEIRDVASWKSVESIGFGPGFSQRLVWSGDGKKIAVAGGECVPVGPNGCRTEGRLWLAELGAGKPAELVDSNPLEYFRDADSVGAGDRFVVCTTVAKQF
ncbi:MAG: WD40 repeat domain-containing protein, partial [Planctomycetaceae bacterium]